MDIAGFLDAQQKKQDIHHGYPARIDLNGLGVALPIF
jgi:hypothetical protein